jgi:hypothetical protein
MTQAGHLFPLCFVLDSTTKQSNHNENTTVFERQIDVMVYKLYELTYDEVLVVEPEFWLSREEYENQFLV